jgi:hypothetical protein
VSAQAAITNHSPLPKSTNLDDDPTAWRLRATGHPHELVDVFGYFNRIGGAYDQQILSKQPIGLPIRYGYLPAPLPLLTPFVVQALYDGVDGFPFLLQPNPDTWEFGLGTQVHDPKNEWRANVGTTNTWNPNGDTHTDYLLGSWMSAKREALPMFFAGSAAQTLIGGDDRSFFLGARQPRGFWHYELQLLHHNKSGDDPIDGNGLLAKASYTKEPRLVPALLAEYSVDDHGGICDPCEQTTLSHFAAGVESNILKGLRLFAYANLGSVDNAVATDRNSSQNGGFFGFSAYTKRVIGDFRLDICDDSKGGLELSTIGRLRLFLTDSLTAFGYLQLRLGDNTDPRDTWYQVYGLAFRPKRHARLYAFLKYKDKLTPSRIDLAYNQHDQLATADVVLPVSKTLALGTRLAWKWSSTYGDQPVMTSLGAEEVTYHFAKRFDLVGGVRVASSSDGGVTTVGTTIGAGMWFDNSYRLMVGFNYAQNSWAFDVDESIPGFFINVTGVYGAAGAPSVMTF